MARADALGVEQAPACIMHPQNTENSNPQEAKRANNPGIGPRPSAGALWARRRPTSGPPHARSLFCTHVPTISKSSAPFVQKCLTRHAGTDVLGRTCGQRGRNDQQDRSQHSASHVRRREEARWAVPEMRRAEAVAHSKPRGQRAPCQCLREENLVPVRFSAARRLRVCGGALAGGGCGGGTPGLNQPPVPPSTCCDAHTGANLPRNDGGAPNSDRAAQWRRARSPGAAASHAARAAQRGRWRSSAMPCGA